MAEWLKLVWKRRQRVLLRKQRKLVQDAFKVHITLNVRSIFHAVNTDLVATPGMMTSQLHVLLNKLFKNLLKLLYSE
jgi:hypothetical protein